MEDKYLKKTWKEENIVFLIHFVDNYAVRQIELENGELRRLSRLEPVVGRSMLTDQPLSEMEVEPDDFISRTEFEEYWSGRRLTDYNFVQRGTEMKGFKTNIEKDTLKNKNFRKVIYTGKNSQLVLMSLKPKEEVGLETHPGNDQFLRFEGGKGRVEIDGNKYQVKDGDALVIPAGAKHNVINTSAEELKIYTIYSPPHHKDGIIHKTKEQAEKDDEEFDGKTTEKMKK